MARLTGVAGGAPRAVGVAMAALAAAQPSARRTIQTVAGAVDPAQLGVTLMHEHGAGPLHRRRGGQPGPLRLPTPCSRARFRSCGRRGARLRDAGRVHAGISRPRSAAAAAAGRASGLQHPVEHRLLRRQQRQAPAAARVHRDPGAARGALDQGERTGDRRHGRPAGVSEDRRGRRAAVGGRRQAGAGGREPTWPAG